MRICVAGAAGRMGRRILELAAADPGLQIAAAFDLPSFAGREVALGLESGQPRPIQFSSDAASAIALADVLIDFTAPDACVANATLAAEAGRPAVLGTTGLNDAQKKELKRLAGKVALVYAPNMSVGVNLLFKLTAEVAAILGTEYNVEITEIHHNQKKDSPSGTAARLAECAAAGLQLDPRTSVVHGREGLVGARPPREIGMHAIRGGDVVGEHAVLFIGNGERIELVHKAHSRDNFARGALRAARFVATAPPGLYDMQDVLGLR